MRGLVRLVLGLSVGACAVLAACTSADFRHEATLTTNARLQVAEAAESSGDSDLATSIYTAAAANEPANIALQLRCAEALARAGKVAQARQILAERLHGNDRPPDLVRALALIDVVAGEPTQALSEFNELLAANPGDIRALVDKAVALDLLGKHTEAQAIYRQVMVTAPSDTAARNNLALSIMLEGRMASALEMLVPLQDGDTAPPRLRINLGILYAANGNLEQSRRLLGDHVTDADLAKITQALTSISVDRSWPQADRPN